MGAIKKQIMIRLWRLATGSVLVGRVSRVSERALSPDGFHLCTFAPQETEENSRRLCLRYRSMRSSPSSPWPIALLRLELPMGGDLRLLDRLQFLQHYASELFN